MLVALFKLQRTFTYCLVNTYNDQMRKASELSHSFYKQKQCLNKSCKWFWWTLKLENHCPCPSLSSYFLLSLYSTWIPWPSISITVLSLSSSPPHKTSKTFDKLNYPPLLRKASKKQTKNHTKKHTPNKNNRNKRKIGTSTRPSMVNKSCFWSKDNDHFKSYSFSSKSTLSSPLPSSFSVDDLTSYLTKKIESTREIHPQLATI